MKELELTMRLRNNRLKQRREEFGMSQPDFAKVVGISINAYNRLETLRGSPLNSNGDWGEPALKLARFHCVEPSELFPAAVLAVQTPIVSRRIDGDDVLALVGEHQERLIESPDVAFDRIELREKLRRAVSTLPKRRIRVLTLRYGLDDGVRRTLEEVGVILGVGVERVRQIEGAAFRELRMPRFRLREFVPKRCESGRRG